MVPGSSRRGVKRRDVGGKDVDRTAADRAGVKRPGVNSSTLVRLLAELAAPELADSRQSFAERLGAWLGWADAISLSAVLNGAAAGTAEPQPATPFSIALALAAADESAHSVAVGQAARVRADLIRSISVDSLFMTPKPGLPSLPVQVPASVPASTAASDSEADFLPYRRSHARHQRAMATRIASLRIDVRTLLAQTSPALGRLAALDAAMDEMLGVHERGLLSTVPAMLQKRFDKLHRAQPAALQPATAAHRPAAWMQGFGKDMQAVLLAELELRMQPVEGLLEALGQEPSPQGKKPQ